jgi:AraC-like DNA-binding protein
MQESHLGDTDAGESGEAIPGPKFISPDKINITHFAPSAMLAPFVTQIYYFCCDERETKDRQSAALGHLMFFLSGSGVVQFEKGEATNVSGAMQYGPGLAAAEFVLSGPAHILGFVLSPLGFVALTGKPANLFADRAVPADELYGPEMGQMADAFSVGHADGSLRIADMIQQTTAFLLGQLRPVPPAHVNMIRRVIDWLSSDLDPDVELLYSQLSMSRSTAARLITRYFGCPAKPLMRKYRAVRAATVLVDPQCTPELRAKVESLFYDQPHMIREIRQFTGRTPGALDGDDSRILRMWLSKDNYRDVETFPG